VHGSCSTRRKPLCSRVDARHRRFIDSMPQHRSSRGAPLWAPLPQSPHGGSLFPCTLPSPLFPNPCCCGPRTDNTRGWKENTKSYIKAYINIFTDEHIYNAGAMLLRAQDSLPSVRTAICGSNKQLIRERLRNCAKNFRYALDVLRGPPCPPRTKKVFFLPLRGSTTPYSYHPDPMITPS